MLLVLNKSILSVSLIAVFSVAGLSGCELESDDSQKQNIIELYEQEVRLVGGVYTHALIEEKRAACVNPDIPNVDINKFKPKIIRLKFRLTDHSARNSGWSTKFKNELETPYLEDTNTIVFWDSASREIGYYTSGGGAFSTNLKVCIASKSTPDIARFIFSASPPDTVKGSGPYDPKWETYQYFDDWLRWNFLHKREPTIDNRMKIREWRLCSWEESAENDQDRIREMRSACHTNLRVQYLGEKGMSPGKLPITMEELPLSAW